MQKFIFTLAFLVLTKTLIGQETKIDPIKISNENFASIVKILLVDTVYSKKKTKHKPKYTVNYLGRGTGFFVTDDGVIFTNRHVVDFCNGYYSYKLFDKEANTTNNKIAQYNNEDFLSTDIYAINYIKKAKLLIQVFSSKNESAYTLYKAKIVNIDTVNFDGAILQIVSDIDGKPLTNKFKPVLFSNSDSTTQGEDLCIYGFPAQYDAGLEEMLMDQSTLTFGKHSGFDYVINSTYGFIKTDAAINSGNSGGPVFNSSGKVIGISTAASKKTNMGLIGGINGMYCLVKENPNIAYKLEYSGITPSKVNIPNPTIKKVFNDVIPNTSQINRKNVLLKNIRKFKGGFWYIKIANDISINNKYSIGQSANTNIITNPNGKLDIKISNKNLNFQFGKVFTLYRFNNFSKLSLDLTFFNLGYYVADWSKCLLYKDSQNTPLQMFNEIEFIQPSIQGGLLYSYLFGTRYVIDAYYKACKGRSFALSRVGKFNNDVSVNYFEKSSIFQVMGFNLRHKFLIFGMQYSFGKINGYFRLPVEKLSTDYKREDILSKNKLSVLSVSLGFNFGGRTKWKKFID